MAQTNPDVFDAVSALLLSLGFDQMALDCAKDRFRVDLPRYAKVILVTCKRNRLPQTDAIRRRLRQLDLIA